MWEVKRIYQIGKVVTGKTPETATKEYYDGKFFFATPTDMSYDTYVLNSTASTLTDIAYEKYRNQFIPANAVMYTSIASIGKIGISNSTLLTNQQINSIIVNKDNNYLFVYYMLRYITPYFVSIAGGAATPIVNKGFFERACIKMPLLESQQKIASVLSVYDKLIQNNNQRIELLEKLASNIYKEWFVRLRFPGYETTYFESGIPEKWKIKRLNDFGRIETGKTPPTVNPENYGGDIMFIKTPDMHGQPYVVETGEYLTEIGHNTQPKKLLPANSISVSCIGTGGIVAINSEPAHTNQQINSIILDDQRYLEWLYFTAKALKPTVEMFGATGATMTNLSKGKFEKLKVICPNKELIYDFNQITSPMLEEIKELQKQNRNLVKQRDLLLPRLMSGKLVVK